MMARRIYLVGAGMFPQRHLTIEGLDALRDSEVVFHTHFPEAGEWLAAVGVTRSVDVSSLYRSDGHDLENYARMTEAVLQATQEFGTVAYLESGHPSLGVSATQTIAALAAQFNVTIEVELVPGVSSIDTVMIDAGFDPLERGCVVVDSNRLLLFRFDIDPRLGLLIYHASSVGTSRTRFSEPWHENRLELLADFLISALGPARKFVAVRSASSPVHPGIVFEGSLDGLGKQVKSIDYGMTIYIPPPPPSGIDREFLNLLLEGESTGD